MKSWDNELYANETAFGTFLRRIIKHFSQITSHLHTHDQHDSSTSDPSNKHNKNVLLDSGNFCYLLITFTNSLDTDQAQQNVSPDLDPNCLTLIMLLKFFFEKVNLKR